MATTNGSRANVHEIANGIYRISTPVDLVPGGFTFNQYLVVDDEPLLFHTGPRRLFPGIRDAVASVVPVERLRWIGFSHVEADECGSLNEWLAAAPHAAPLCGQVAAMVSIGDIASSAGVTRGLVHHYFGGRKDVYLALLERVGTIREERLRAPVGPSVP